MMPTSLQRSIFIHWFARLLPVLLIVLMLGASATDVWAGQKTDKFRGTVVNAGPTAISVKSETNIYQIRSFDYTPALKKKIDAKRPAQGKKVTVHYYRGTNIAVSVD
jgi:hypothetical protein